MVADTDHLPYRTISAPVHTDLIEKKSRFLTLLTPVAGIDDVQALLSARKKEYWDATHNCSAYRLLDGTERSNDDGEPSGTAGRPMLHVLQQHGLVGVLAIVTRYFGGTLLGAGGLVRAYGGAVAEAVAAAEIVTYREHERYEFDLSYADYERTQAQLALHSTWRVEAEYAEVVHVALVTPTTDHEQVQERIAALTRTVTPTLPVGTLWLPGKA